MFGGDDSPWARYFAPLFGSAGVPSRRAGAPAISEGVDVGCSCSCSSSLGFAIAWLRYATAAAQRDAVARLRSREPRACRPC